jgi:hypothetical protein
MYRHQHRQLTNRGVVFDHVDLLDSDGYTLLDGVALGDVVLSVWLDGQTQPWDLVDGAPITNAQVVSGHVYWVRTGDKYTIRWRPSATGLWRMLFDYATVPQRVVLSYDIFAQTSTPSTLTVSFG